MSNTLSRLQRVYSKIVFLLKETLKKSRLSTLGIVAALALVSGWTATRPLSSSSEAPNEPAANSTVQSNHAEMHVISEPEPTPDTSTSNESIVQTEIHSDTGQASATVTVNGHTTTVPPDQTFEETYTSEQDGNHTKIEVYVDNGQSSQTISGSSSATSLNVDINNQSRSDSNTSSLEGRRYMHHRN